MEKHILDMYRWTSKEATIPVLQQINIKDSKAVACDSFRLLEIDNAHQTPEDKWENLSINRFEAQRNLKTGEPITEEVQEDYPKYEDIIPRTEPKVTIEVNVSYLKELARYFEKHGKTKRVTMEIHGQHEPIVFKQELKSGEKALAMIMPIMKYE